MVGSRFWVVGSDCGWLEVESRWLEVDFGQLGFNVGS